MPIWREGVLERPVCLLAVQRAQEDPEEDERDAAPHRVQQHPVPALTAAGAADNRECHRRADEKRERRLNQVVQRAALPLDVRGVEGDELPEPVARERPAHGHEMHRFGEHQEHDEAAECVDRQDPRLDAGGERRRRWRCIRRSRHRCARTGTFVLIHHLILHSRRVGRSGRGPERLGR